MKTSPLVLATLLGYSQATTVTITTDDAGLQKTAMDIQSRVPQFLNDNQGDLMAVAGGLNNVVSEFANRAAATQAEKTKLLLTMIEQVNNTFMPTGTCNTEAFTECLVSSGQGIDFMSTYVERNAPIPDVFNTQCAIDNTCQTVYELDKVQDQANE
jgi:hypothetical protein